MLQKRTLRDGVFFERALRRMVRVVDKLNTPWALAVVLVLFLLVDGLLLYRYQLAQHTAAATPSFDATLTADRAIADPNVQQAPGVEETAEEGEQPEGEEQGAIMIEVAGPEPASGLTEDPPLASSSTVDSPTTVPGEKESAMLPAPEPAYSQPAYEQEDDYQYGDYQYGDYQYGDYQYGDYQYGDYQYANG